MPIMQAGEWSLAPADKPKRRQRTPLAPSVGMPTSVVRHQENVFTFFCPVVRMHSFDGMAYIQRSLAIHGHVFSLFCSGGLFLFGRIV